MKNLTKLFESIQATVDVQYAPEVDWDDRCRNLISDFVGFVCDELQLAKERLPTIYVIHEKEGDMTTGVFMPGPDGGGIIKMISKGRHPIDVCRSLAHELVHHWQFENGLITHGSQIKDVGGPEENQANATAGTLVKKYTYKVGKHIYDITNHH